jgi:hypothetical protein
MAHPAPPRFATRMDMVQPSAIRDLLAAIAEAK